MFLGEYEHTLDDKGRLAIPARFREELGESVVITRGLDHCLMGFTQTYWSQLAGQVSGLALGEFNARNIRRLLFGSATEQQMDRQGRIVVPQTLRERASLGDAVVVVGLNTYFEIWSRARWEALQQDMDDNSGALAEQLAAIGI